MGLGFEPYGSAPHQRSAALPCCPGLWKVTCPAHRTCGDVGLHRLFPPLLACPLPLSAFCCNTWKLMGFVAGSLSQPWRWVTSSALGSTSSQTQNCHQCGARDFPGERSAQRRGQGPAMATPAPAAYCRCKVNPQPHRLMPSWPQFSSPLSQNICPRGQQPPLPCQPGESPASQALLAQAASAQVPSPSI